MSEDKDQEALNKSGEETAPEATPATEKQTTEEVTKVEEPPAQGEAKTKVTETEDKPKKSKKGVDARIGQLTKKVKQTEAEKKSLADKLEEVTSQFGSRPKEPTPTPPEDVKEPIVKPGEEIDGLELEKRLAERDQRLLQQARAETDFANQVNRVTENINKEAREVIDTHSELNPNSESFDKDLSETVTEATEAFVKANPTGSVKKFVNKLMKPYKRAVTKAVGEDREKVVKQVSQQALRPTVSPKGKKEAKDKSLKEMEQELGVVY